MNALIMGSKSLSIKSNIKIIKENFKGWEHRLSGSALDSICKALGSIPNAIKKSGKMKLKILKYFIESKELF
jgi:hypothetical protein